MRRWVRTRLWGVRRTCENMDVGIEAKKEVEKKGIEGSRTPRQWNCHPTMGKIMGFYPISRADAKVGDKLITTGLTRALCLT